MLGTPRKTARGARHRSRDQCSFPGGRSSFRCPALATRRCPSLPSTGSWSGSLRPSSTLRRPCPARSRSPRPSDAYLERSKMGEPSLLLWQSRKQSRKRRRRRRRNWNGVALENVMRRHRQTAMVKSTCSNRFRRGAFRYVDDGKYQSRKEGEEKEGDVQVLRARILIEEAAVACLAGHHDLGPRRREGLIFE